jgi:MinD superfamily P-loop ATPase
VCINKADTNIQLSQKIKAYCDTHHLPFLGEIAYDPTVLKALNQNKNILEYSCKASEDIHLLYQQLIKYINNQTN